MRKDRSQILENFKSDELLQRYCKLSKEELEQVSFSSNSNILLLEALKKLIQSYCNDDAEITVLKNITVKIEENS